jgi:putative MFS transporter
MYAIGAVLALIGILLRFELPESPRWLIGRGRVEEADAVVADMERVAARHSALPEPRFAREADREVDTAHGNMPYRAVLGNPMYLRRVLLRRAAVWRPFVVSALYQAWCPPSGPSTSNRSV